MVYNYEYYECLDIYIHKHVYKDIRRVKKNREKVSEIPLLEISGTKHLRRNFSGFSSEKTVQVIP